MRYLVSAFLIVVAGSISQAGFINKCRMTRPKPVVICPPVQFCRPVCSPPIIALAEEEDVFKPFSLEDEPTGGGIGGAILVGDLPPTGHETSFGPAVGGGTIVLTALAPPQLWVNLWFWDSYRLPELDLPRTPTTFTPAGTPSFPPTNTTLPPTDTTIPPPDQSGPPVLAVPCQGALEMMLTGIPAAALLVWWHRRKSGV